MISFCSLYLYLKLIKKLYSQDYFHWCCVHVWKHIQQNDIFEGGQRKRKVSLVTVPATQPKHFKTLVSIPCITEPILQHAWIQRIGSRTNSTIFQSAQASIPPKRLFYVTSVTWVNHRQRPWPPLSCTTLSWHVKIATARDI